MPVKKPKKPFDPTVGRRMKRIRVKHGLTQEDVSKRTGISAPFLSKIENGQRGAGPEVLNKFASAFPGVGVQDLTEGQRRGTPSRSFRYDENQKPPRLGSVVLDNVCLLIGNHTEPFDFSVRYNGNALQIPTDVKPHFTKLVAIAKQRTVDAKSLYFNGPCARLLCISRRKARQLASGDEAQGFVFELGPASWDEYTVLNTNLDRPLFSDGGTRTLRGRYVDFDKLYNNGPDLRWCKLSNLLTVCMVPITSDGYGLIQHRSRTGTSEAGDKLISGISENIHRYLDEAPRDDLTVRLNELRSPASKPVDHLYRPRGVPSPLLTAQRGVYEELSEGLYYLLKGAPHRFQFLNVVMGLDYFHPLLVGIILLPFTQRELKRLIEESPGKDHGEYRALHYLKLDSNDSRTATFLGEKDRWVAAGLSSLITAIHYWQKHGA